MMMDENKILAELEEARQQRIDLFMKEYREMSAKHGCDFAATPHITQNGTIKCSIAPTLIR